VGGSPPCTKDLVEESFFARNRNLFSILDLLLFDTISIKFESQGRAHLGRKGFGKDQRPELNQVIAGMVLDYQGIPLCCQMWPGNTTDVKTLVQLATGIRQRFNVIQWCLEADRGMISQESLEVLEDPASTTPYILGVRIRHHKEVREEVSAPV
jgi:transposase